MFDQDNGQASVGRSVPVGRLTQQFLLGSSRLLARQKRILGSVRAGRFPGGVVDSQVLSTMPGVLGWVEKIPRVLRL